MFAGLKLEISILGDLRAPQILLVEFFFFFFGCPSNPSKTFSRVEGAFSLEGEVCPQSQVKIIYLDLPKDAK